jgi:glutamine---fructose-6-phosphate transaminase (isomerizing)
MCGIVGYVGRHKASPIIIEGLKRLEYRGYDSAGLALLHDGSFTVAKKVGRVEALVKEAARHTFIGTCGIGHTRWATHGGVTDANAHPHVSDGQLALIHNGVIENYARSKNSSSRRATPSNPRPTPRCSAIWSPTTTPRSPSRQSDASRFLESVRKTLRHVEGTYGIVVLCVDRPRRVRRRAQGLAAHPRRRRRDEHMVASMSPRSSAAPKTSFT